MFKLAFTSFFICSFFGANFWLENELPFSATEELKTFQLAPGYKIQLVASEPMVEDPVIVQFDEQGRLWVVEMRGYMQDIDGNKEDEPIGRVIYLEDTTGDFVMDKRTVFADGLVMPRAISFFQEGVLISENIPLWFFEDTNGDGKADKKTLVDSTYGGGGLPEHSANGLLLGHDNWLYNAKSKFRYKKEGEQWIKEETEFRGQYGIAKDDLGRLYYNYNWSQLHADLVSPNSLNRNKNHEPTTGIDHGLTIDRRIYPIRPNLAVNRGYIPGTLDEEGKLREFTSACSPVVMREEGVWPENAYNSVFVCEPAGNLIKQNLVKTEGNYLLAENAINDKEFLASTDERFRPVALTSGPEGAIYIADMYRGISQHGAYMTEYLKKVTLERGLDKYIHLGRIWRVIPDKAPKVSAKNIKSESPEQWVQNLSHPISWVRDQSLRMLMQQKPKQMIYALENLIKSGNTRAKIYAFYALSGMQRLRPIICLQNFNGNQPQVAAVALRLYEPFWTKDAQMDNLMEKRIENLLQGKSDDVIDLQVLLSSNHMNPTLAFRAIERLIEIKGEDPLFRDAALSATSNRELALLKHLLAAESWKIEKPEKSIFLEQLSGILFKRRNEQELLQFLDMVASLDGWQVPALLSGVSIQAASNQADPVELSKPLTIKTKNPADLIPFRSNIEKGFHWPGKKVLESDKEQKIVLNAEGMKQFAAGRQSFLTYCAGCHGSNGKGMKRFAPPLAGSEWVIGEDKRLALILLHGIEGPIEVSTQRYDVPDILPVMPSHSTLDDADIANIMTYIRNAWGHSSEPTSRRMVGMLRIQSQGKVQPWNSIELNEHLNKLQNTNK